MLKFRSYIKNFPALIKKLLPEDLDIGAVDIWQQDESRVGQQGSTTRIWAKIGTRPRKVRQQQFISTYIYGAVCAKTGEAFGLVLPYTDTEGMQLFLDELSCHIKVGRHIALVIDNAGWHTTTGLAVPQNITLIPLPPYSPELNAVEQVWHWIKSHYLSNCNFKDYNDIVDKASFAWNEFVRQPDLVKSMCGRDWLRTL
jgi:transposase